MPNFNPTICLVYINSAMCFLRFYGGINSLGLLGIYCVCMITCMKHMYMNRALPSSILFYLLVVGLLFARCYIYYHQFIVCIFNKYLLLMFMILQLIYYSTQQKLGIPVTQVLFILIQFVLHYIYISIYIQVNKVENFFLHVYIQS